MEIPDDLARSIVRGDAVLFVGSGLSAAAGLPSWRELLEPLADRIRLPADQRADLLKVAQHYANQRGLQSLLSHIIDATETIDKSPTDNHRRLLRLGIRTWITTNYDDLLEQTLRQQRARFTKIVRDRDLPYASAEALTLIKLHGDRDQPDTIVITQQDYANYFRRFPRVKEKLSSLLVDKTFLFVGYSVSDPDFAQIQSGITFDLQEHQRMAYAVLFDADEFALADMRNRNIQVLNISADPADRSARLGDLLDQLIGSVGGARPAAVPPTPPAPAPATPTTAPTPSVAPASSPYQYDAFISHHERDRDWVYRALLPPLERAGLRLCLEDRDFAIGVPKLINRERAVEQSRKTLLVLSPDWVGDDWAEFEGILAQSRDPAGRRQRMLPVIARPCELPWRLAQLTPLDLSNSARFDAQIARLIAALRAS